MRRQNRVTPFGRIVAPPADAAARGDWFGNRGCIHDPAGRIVRPWRLRAWLICRLQFKGRRRALMQPGRYTELFFLDEATAFAAGHRPCGECRWHDYQRFRACWPGLHGQPVDEVDAVLHRERIAGDRRRARLDSLPDGSFVALDDAPDTAWLKWGGALYPWSLDGYGAPLAYRREAAGIVLTPPSLVAALARGYPIGVHASGPSPHVTQD
jgi:hypothetical protein